MNLPPKDFFTNAMARLLPLTVALTDACRLAVLALDLAAEHLPNGTDADHTCAQAVAALQRALDVAYGRSASPNQAPASKGNRFPSSAPGLEGSQPCQ